MQDTNLKFCFLMTTCFIMKPDRSTTVVQYNCTTTNYYSISKGLPSISVFIPLMHGKPKQFAPQHGSMLDIQGISAQRVQKKDKGQSKNLAGGPHTIQSILHSSQQLHIQTREHVTKIRTDLSSNRLCAASGHKERVLSVFKEC